MHLLIMGPPGAGKGTQAGRIGAHYEIPAISTGDMFRAMQDLDTPLAQQVQEIMASGAYVPDDVTNQVVADRLLADDCAQGFLLDGYPRTLQQVDYLDGVLDEGGRAIDAVISLAVDSDELVSPAAHAGATTAGRADDTPEAIRTRQQVYVDQTAPLLDVYRDRGLLVEVDGLGEVDEVTRAALRRPRPAGRQRQRPRRRSLLDPTRRDRAAPGRRGQDPRPAAADAPGRPRGRRTTLDAVVARGAARRHHRRARRRGRRDDRGGRGRSPSFLGYGADDDRPGFPGVVCLSVDDEVVHGMPGPRVLVEGDLLSSTAARSSTAGTATPR